MEDGVQPQKGDSSHLHAVAPLRGGHQRRSSEVAVEIRAVEVEKVAEQCARPYAVASRRWDVYYSFLLRPIHVRAWTHAPMVFGCHGHDRSWYDLGLLTLQPEAQQLEGVRHQLYQRKQNYLDDVHMAAGDRSSQLKQVGQGLLA